MQLIKLLSIIKHEGNRLLQIRNFPMITDSISSYPSLHLEYLRVLWLIPSSPRVTLLFGRVARGIPTPILQLFNFILKPQASTIIINVTCFLPFYLFPMLTAKQINVIFTFFCFNCLSYNFNDFYRMEPYSTSRPCKWFGYNVDLTQSSLVK